MPGHRSLVFALAFLASLAVVACGPSTTPPTGSWPTSKPAVAAGAGTSSNGGSGSVTTNPGGTASMSGSAGALASSGGSAGASTTPAECGTPSTAAISVAWDAINKQPAAFYASAEARAVADNILYYQNADHGWPKNIDMTSRTAAKAGSTIDNRGTTTQLEFLARTYGGTSCPQYRDAMLGAVDFLLSAQYENGGWPQVYPNPKDYHTHITFNDDAMIHVLQVLRNIGAGTAPYGFVDPALRASTMAAVAKGVECVLACQIKMPGGQRGWCAQHDEVTLAPAQARTYELPSVSGSEGAQIVRFLMTIDPPTPEIREAVEGAVAWFEANKITGIRIEATRPFFSSRCEVPECDADPFFMRRYSLAEIDNERRIGYAWYGNWPAAALSEYRAWKAK